MMKRAFLLMLTALMLTASVGTAAELGTSITVSEDGEAEMPTEEQLEPIPETDSEPDTDNETADVYSEGSERELTDTAELSSTSAGTAELDNTVFDGFPDCKGHWAQEVISEYVKSGCINGYADGNFYPDNPVTAAEFAKIYSARKGSVYKLTEGHWALPYIRDMLSAGIFDMSEYSDYNTPMSRAQVAKAVVSSLKNEYFPNDLSAYKALIPDISGVDTGFSDYIAKAYMSGIMSGYEDGSFRPDGKVTRAEILSVIDRATEPEKRVVPEKVKNTNVEDEKQNVQIIYADQAKLEGGMVNLFGTGESSYLENFRNEQKITFKFNARVTGKCKMTINYSANLNSGGGTVAFDLNGTKFEHTFAQTGAWTAYVDEYLGEVELKDGENTLIITDKEIPNTYLINIKSISFEKTE